ncbi:ParB-like nuclease domain protein [Pseudomonas phage phiK7B1]|nr:ParB-like nuclease domain protein [Pseudomonas phage phiK7B1]UIS24567.1 ParB-like nuclease domain protein [Pseudomonas phage ZY21]
MTDSYEKKDESWSIDRLVPYAGNSKRHDPKQVSKIAASIRKYGWTTRIVVEEDGTIIAGHGRRLAAIELLQEKVPVTVIKGISKEQARALRLIDNKTNEGGHDTGLLSMELKSLVLDDGIDMGEFFDVRDLNFAIEDLGDMDLDSLSADIAPEVAAQTTRTEKEIETTDEDEVSLTKAIGISKITGTQSRELKRFVGEAQDFYNCTPAEALLRALEDWAATKAADEDDLK